ncbi:MAG TPA: SET domain-containing protein [Acidisarcina sp.]
MDTKQYLDYLDKEMSIMGILTAASVIAPGGVLNAALTSDKGQMTALWNADHFFILSGSVFCTLAALFFYKERSTLAWYYGQISLEEIVGAKDSIKLREWLKEADSWETWWPYDWGFIFLVTGFIEYLLALVFFLLPQEWPWLAHHILAVKSLVFCVCVVAAAAIAAEQWYVRTRYRFSDNPHSDLLSAVLRRSPNEDSPRVPKMMPHDGVFTRLRPSQVHGVGVFAIRDIPEGAAVFGTDDGELIEVTDQEARVLPPELRELYTDFCVLRNDNFKCPTTFNSLTPSWYLNNSKDPNVASDIDLKFYAIRDIKAGEELTADYKSYSDNNPG